MPEEIKNGICYMCTASCATKVHVDDGKVTQIDIVDPVAAAICPRGKAQLDFIYHPDRLKQPLKRSGKDRNSAFVPISWDEALDIVAANFLKVKKEYGPESVVFWIAYTKEPRPYFHRLTHAFGSPNYCTESSNCFSSQWLATVLTYGVDYGYWVLQSGSVNPATKCKMIWSTSIKNNAPYNWQKHVEAKRNGMKLIVVDPRRTEIASMADIHLQLRPGTDGALALGMLNILIGENLYDKEFMEKWTVGFDDLKKLVKDYTPEKTAEITWVPADTIKKAAMLYATEKPAQIMFGTTPTTHHFNGVQNQRALILLPALTGNFEVPGGNRWILNHLPLNDITLHDRVTSMPPGLGTDRFPIWTTLYKEMESNVMAERIDSGQPYPIKALFGAGLNPMFFPNSNRFVENVKKLDFVVVTDYFHTPGTQLADVVLPIASWLERHMLVTKPNGYVTMIEPAIESVGDSWPEWKIYFELAKRLGVGDEFWGGDIIKCLDYILEPSGFTVDDLRRNPEGMQYQVCPRPDKDYEQAGFKTPSGKVEISSSILAQHGHHALPVYQEPPESPLSRPDLLDKFPLVLTSGARTLPYTHSLFRNIPRLREQMPNPLVDINPEDADERNIKTGDLVTVLSPRGCVCMRANVTDTILPGVVSVPHHWPGEANVNAIIDDKNLDPISGFGQFKSTLCNVMRA